MADIQVQIPTDAQIDAAMERGRIADQSEPRAKSARYEQRKGHIVVELTNGCTFAFPPNLAQGLGDASANDLATLEILGGGYGLNWPTLDVQLSIPGLLSGLFGTRVHMARQAGRALSPAKSAAARANGAKGGRPRKISAA